jgi:hypothetical protein
MNTSVSLLFTIGIAFYCEMHRRMSTMGDEGMTPRSSIFAYPVPAKEEARSKDTWSPQGPALRLGVEGKNYM